MFSRTYVNHQALAALTQLILILALMGPLLFRVHRSRATFFYVGLLASGVLQSSILLIEALKFGDSWPYDLALWHVTLAFSTLFAVQFAYVFPRGSIDRTTAERMRREAKFVLYLSIAFSAMATSVAISTLTGIGRPDVANLGVRLVDVWSVVGWVWGTLVLWRRAAHFSEVANPERKPWKQWLLPSGRYAHIAVIMALVGLVPVTVVVLLAIQPFSTSPVFVFVPTIGLLLAYFVGGLLFYNYSEETISVLVKLSVTTLAIVLVSISLVGATVEPRFLDAFHRLAGESTSIDFLVAQRTYLHEMMLPLFWLLIGLSAFILFGFPFFFRYILVVPLRSLMNSVHAVDRGDLTVRSTVYFPDEIGVVTDAFNRMVASVEQVEEGLEAQVMRRTEALAEATAQAQAASKAKSDFLAHMSHELRTPLNGILGYAQILREDDTMSPHQIEGIDVIEASGRHLLALIDDILDLSRIEADKLALNLADFSLPALLDGVIQMMRYTAEEKGLRLEWTPPPNLPPRVYGDQRRLRQVLINLLGNALKFTNEGHVSLQVDRLDNPEDAAEDDVTRLRFAVQDTGIGLSTEQINEIFRPFEQAQADGTSAQGAGLGLPISQRLVQLMGGEIQVESRVNQGSRFWFDLALPCVEEAKGEETIGESRPAAIVTDRSAQLRADLLLPPLSARIAIYESARLGDMHQIEIEASRLAHESEVYRPFAERVLALAAKFNDAAIQALVQPDVDDNSGEDRV
jgi:signal transduction histidine kinase